MSIKLSLFLFLSARCYLKFHALDNHLVSAVFIYLNTRVYNGRERETIIYP